MKKHRRICILAAGALVVGTSCMPIEGRNKENGAPVIPLCQALAEVSAGEAIPVVVKGVIRRGPEMTVLYDPEEIVCPMDVQPSTLAEIPSGRSDLEQLTRFLREYTQAEVTVQGLLHGPAPLGNDDLSLPTILAYSKRIAHRRYGHRGFSRTKLVVQTVLGLSPAPSSEVAQFILTKPERKGSGLPTVRSLSLPSYPERARKVNLSGDVHVVARVEGGLVAAVQVVEGDRLFHAETIENVQSWTFSEPFTADLDVAFSYRLEQRPTDSAGGVRVELSLPSRVLIIAPAYGW